MTLGGFSLGFPLLFVIISNSIMLSINKAPTHKGAVMPKERRSREARRRGGTITSHLVGANGQKPAQEIPIAAMADCIETGAGLALGCAGTSGLLVGSPHGLYHVRASSFSKYPPLPFASLGVTFSFSGCLLVF